MLLSLVLHTYSMRYVLPAAVMMGTAPTYILAWGAWRLLSTLLPARFYHQVDDRLYTIYQSMVLFFFENYTGVQVRAARGLGWGTPFSRSTLQARPSLQLVWAEGAERGRGANGDRCFCRLFGPNKGAGRGGFGGLVELRPPRAESGKGRALSCAQFRLSSIANIDKRKKASLGLALLGPLRHQG